MSAKKTSSSTKKRQRKLPIWKLRYYTRLFLLGDREWGKWRWRASIVIILGITLVSALVFERETIHDTAFSILNLFPELIRVPWLLYPLALIFNGSTWRYITLPISALALSLAAGGLFVQNVYEVKSFRKSLSYVFATTFGMGYPRLAIEDGKKKLEEDEVNLIDKVGGPGFVHIAPGNVVLFERVDGSSEVRGQGFHFIPRHETIKEIGCLDDQHGYIAATTAMTKDGIVITVRDVNFRYRMRTGRKEGDYTQRTPDLPYPYSVQAVRNMAYNRTVRANGAMPWYDGIRQAVDSVITDYIAEHQFDQIMIPNKNESDAREDMKRRMKSPATRARLKNIGAELLWCDIGQFEVADPRVTEQRLAAWSARWVGDARVERSYAEARRLANQEQARAEAQSEILMSILSAFDQVGVSPDSKQNLWAIILNRTAQVIEALVEETQNGQEQEDE